MISLLSIIINIIKTVIVVLVGYSFYQLFSLKSNAAGLYYYVGNLCIIAVFILQYFDKKLNERRKRRAKFD